MPRLAALAVALALAVVPLTGCQPGRTSTTTATSDADAAVTEPAAAPAPVVQPTPATQPTPPTAPAAKEPAVQPPQPGPAKPGAALDVEVFAYQATGLAADGADAAGGGAKSIVLLVARGKHRSGGWTSELIELPLRIFPPQFELRTTPPPEGSMNMQMITPFTAASWVRMDQPVPSLKVRVDGELRDVKVEPANKIKSAMPSGR